MTTLESFRKLRIKLITPIKNILIVQKIDFQIVQN